MRRGAHAAQRASHIAKCKDPVPDGTCHLRCVGGRTGSTERGEEKQGNRRTRSKEGENGLSGTTPALETEECHEREFLCEG
jgi:hypothetical protein